MAAVFKSLADLPRTKLACRCCGVGIREGGVYYMPRHQQGPLCLGCLDIPPDEDDEPEATEDDHGH